MNFFFLVYPESSYRDTFNQLLPTMRNSLAGSVDDLCMAAIGRRLMTFPERAAILQGDNKFEQASKLLEHFGMKIQVSPEVFPQFVDILTTLGTCDELVQKLSKLKYITLYNACGKCKCNYRALLTHHRKNYHGN